MTSSPKTVPQQAPVPPVVDPDNVAEKFVTELTGTQVVGPNLHLTFSVIRPSHEVTAPGVMEITTRRVVAMRPVIPLAVIPDIIQQLRQIMDGRPMDPAAAPSQRN